MIPNRQKPPHIVLVIFFPLFPILQIILIYHTLRPCGFAIRRIPLSGFTILLFPILCIIFPVFKFFYCFARDCKSAAAAGLSVLKFRHSVGMHRSVEKVVRPQDALSPLRSMNVVSVRNATNDGKYILPSDASLTGCGRYQMYNVEHT
jgi:hypothetical protein